MTVQNKQVNKNILLSEKLADFLVAHPSFVSKFGEVSFVIFTEDDAVFNKRNANLIKGLINEGKQVVKAKVTENKNDSWFFTPITP